MTHEPIDSNSAAAFDGLTSALDRLSAHDRASADAGFESRIVNGAMRATIHSSDSPQWKLNARALPDKPVASSIAGLRWRIAAAVALSTATLAGVTWLASQHPVSLVNHPSIAAVDAQALASDLDAFLSANTQGWDRGLESSITTVRKDIESVSTEDDAFWRDGTAGFSDLLSTEDTL